MSTGPTNSASSSSSSTTPAPAPAKETWSQFLARANPVAIIEQVKTDVEAVQADITKISGGMLTITTEIGLLRTALTAAGINLPPSVLAELNSAVLTPATSK